MLACRRAKEKIKIINFKYKKHRFKRCFLYYQYYLYILGTLGFTISGEMSTLAISPI